MELLFVLLNSGTSVVESWLALFDKYGVGWTALVVVVFFSWYMIRFTLKRFKKQDEQWDKLVNKLTTKENDGLSDDKLQTFAKNASKVQQIIYSLLNEFDADRIAVFEYHNGGKTITGVDFKKCSNTYEAVGKRIEEKHQEYQNIPISVNFLWNKLLIEKKPIFISDILSLEQTDNTIFSTLQQQNTKSYYSRLITNYTDRPIGFIIVYYYDKVTILSNEQLKSLSDASICIGSLINKD